mgnify:CR=1 FL=1
MSKENTVEELSEDIEVIGPGQILSEAREKMGLTQQQVADKLNFRTTLVKDIEADNFDHSLPATFNRGYLKNYAKLVEVSADEILAGYEMLNVAKKQGAEMQSFSKQTKKQAENNLVMWISYLILALLIGSTALWWIQDTNKSDSDNNPANNAAIHSAENKGNATSSNKLNDDLPSETAENSAINPATVTTLSQTLKDDAPSQLKAEDNSEIESASTLANNSEEKSPITSNLMDSTSIENQAAGETSNTEQSDSALANNESNEIDFGPLEAATFVFSGDCWVNIYDATGERIAWGIKKSGYVMNISGQAPFTITLGKPELVSIEFENETVDMSQFSRGNIAKFNLPLI